MSKDKYVGLDVHKATIVIAVLNAVGQVVMKTIIATDTQVIREFFKGLSGTVSVALEEGTQSAWLYALLRPLVKDVVVCNPRHNKLIETGNINAPLNSNRPILDAGNITQIESSASSTSHTWMVNMNWMKMGKFMFGANYVLSKATDETDSPLSLPVNNFDLRAERGPSLQDIRHRFFAMGNYRLSKSLSISSIFQASSAAPYNVTTGFDDNGDTIINDRPRGLSRNSARAAGMWDLSSRLSYSFGFGKPPETQGAGGPQVRIIRGGSSSGDMLGAMGGMPGQTPKRFRTEFFIQATNLFNHANLIGFSGVQTSPFFGQPIAAMPGRRLETGMRFSF